MRIALIQCLETFDCADRGAVRARTPEHSVIDREFVVPRLKISSCALSEVSQETEHVVAATNR
jgi:hypothetical protein